VQGVIPSPGVRLGGINVSHRRGFSLGGFREDSIKASSFALALATSSPTPDLISEMA
jgi:hypothetical protein